MRSFLMRKRLNIILGCIVLVESFAFYQHVQNTSDSISFDNVSQFYIAKNDVKFSDLPVEIQEQYVEKERVIYTKDDDLEDSIPTDENGMPILEEQASQNDFQKAIHELQNNIIVLKREKEKLREEADIIALKLQEQTAKQEDVEQFYKDINQEILAQREEEIKSLYKQLNQSESTTIKANNQQIKTLKEQLAQANQTHLNDETKYKALQEEYKHKEQSYLNQIQEVKLLSKTQEKNLLLAKSEIEKKLLSTEETLKTLQAKLKSFETRSNGKSDKTSGKERAE